MLPLNRKSRSGSYAPATRRGRLTHKIFATTLGAVVGGALMPIASGAEPAQEGRAHRRLRTDRPAVGRLPVPQSS
jgi:hypothetical protein